MMCRNPAKKTNLFNPVAALTLNVGQFTLSIPAVHSQVMLQATDLRLQLQHEPCKKLCYHRWTARHTMSVKILSTNKLYSNTHKHTPPFNGLFSGTTRVGRYQKGKTNLDFTEARDSEWQRHQLGRMQVCTSLLTDNYASTSPLSFLQAGCPSCHPTNNVKALKAKSCTANQQQIELMELEGCS